VFSGFAAGWRAVRWRDPPGLAGFVPLLRQQLFAFVITVYY